MLHARRELTLGGVWRGGSSRLAMLMIMTLSAQPEATESKNFIHTHKERNDPRKFGRIYLHFLANGCCNDRFCDSITGNLGSSKWENIGHAKNDAFLAQHQSDSIYHARWISSDSMTQLEKNTLPWAYPAWIQITTSASSFHTNERWSSLYREFSSRSQVLSALII